jgi:hypothetical protein
MTLRVNGPVSQAGENVTRLPIARARRIVERPRIPVVVYTCI